MGSLSFDRKKGGFTMKNALYLGVLFLLGIVVVGGCGKNTEGVIASVTTSTTTTSTTTTIPLTVNSPGKPSVVRTSGTTAILTWEASTSAGIAGYYIYRGTTTEGSGLSNIGSTAFSVKSYTDNGLTSIQGYYYAVSAITAAQESQKSEVAYVAPYSANLPIMISGVK
jgi:hypothetical protein